MRGYWAYVFPAMLNRQQQFYVYVMLWLSELLKKNQTCLRFVHKIIDMLNE